jgi:transposase InsO family protein
MDKGHGFHLFRDMGNTWGMPWITTTMMSQRLEFVRLAGQAGINFRQLCRRFNLSAKTGYKWRRRFAEAGEAGLADRSRRPRCSPGLSSPEIATQVIAVRTEHPTWGGRKLRRRLQNLGVEVPSANTCTAILRRADLLGGQDQVVSKPWQRFEREQPNELWQMDFKGHFATQAGPRCHPLTVLDDRSRFNLVLNAEANQTAHTVQTALAKAFTHYGLPEAMLCDNGAPWGCTDSICPHTSLTVWLLRLGIRVIHGRPYHPQTQGKEERFHRTLKRDLISRHTWRDLAHCAELFPRYRHTYNCERPHDSLAGDTPISHYRSSPRSLPATLPSVNAPAGAIIRIVHSRGAIVWKNQSWYIGRAFGGLPIGLRPSAQADGQWLVSFDQHQLGIIDLNEPTLAKHQAHSIYLHPPKTTP